jgi:hypothetical protein
VVEAIDTDGPVIVLSGEIEPYCSADGFKRADLLRNAASFLWDDEADAASEFFAFVADRVQKGCL